MPVLSVMCVVLSFVGSEASMNYVTLETVDAYISENGVTVNAFCHNEDGILEYFNLVTFDDSKLEYVSIEADRGDLWYGYYPTHVDGDKIYIHGVAEGFGCIEPDTGVPGSPLYHIVFNVKPDAEVGLSDIVFLSEPVWDGHWNDCSGSQVTPPPSYSNGGVYILGHSGHITVGSDTTGPGEQAAVDVYMHNDLDVFEYWNRILFDSGVASVDSIVAARGALHHGFYPTHVSGDTIYVHGWTGDAGECFYAGHSWPGAPLYRIYMTVHEWVPTEYTMPLTFLAGDPVWNHWVGCDLATTDLFTGSDGAVHVQAESGILDVESGASTVTLASPSPNPTDGSVSLRFYLPESAPVDLVVYDVAGRLVKTLTRCAAGAGWQTASWDGTDARGKSAASGVYLCRLEAGGAVATRKMIHLRR
ncbi:MAG: T9SS type A sorting domain-containing protein [Candidatus Eisenbacteria bacterium]|nr:T9SS type A sorting domain-containing protein [Candidatus Eisenbacteria bacterium]